GYSFIIRISGRKVKITFLPGPDGGGRQKRLAARGGQALFNMACPAEPPLSEKRSAARRRGQRRILTRPGLLQILKIPQGGDLDAGGVHPSSGGLRLLGQGGGVGPRQLPPNALRPQTA